MEVSEKVAHVKLTELDAQSILRSVPASAYQVILRLDLSS